MSNLPKQVQAQLDEAARIDQLIQDQLNPSSDPSDDEGQPTGTGDPAAAPASVSGDPAAPAPASSDEDTWKHRFNTLQGKYNAEVPRLTRELADLRSQLAGSTARIEALVAAQNVASTSKLVTDKDVEAFGPDLVDLVRRQATEVARAEASVRVSEVQQENAQLKSQVSNVAERQVVNDREAYQTNLAQIVPDWAALNTDEGFLGWLAEIDPISGSARHEHLMNAYNALNVAQTANIFNAYKALRAPANTSQTTTNRQQLERQIAPGTSKSSNGPSSAEPKWFTVREIDQFYKDTTLGVYKGREDEFARVEAEIDAAAAEGRIRP